MEAEDDISSCKDVVIVNLQRRVDTYCDEHKGLWNVIESVTDARNEGEVEVVSLEEASCRGRIERDYWAAFPVMPQPPVDRFQILRTGFNRWRNLVYVRSIEDVSMMRERIRELESVIAHALEVERGVMGDEVRQDVEADVCERMLKYSRKVTTYHHSLGDREGSPEERMSNVVVSVDELEEMMSKARADFAVLSSEAEF